MKKPCWVANPEIRELQQGQPYWGNVPPYRTLSVRIAINGG